MTTDLHLSCHCQTHVVKLALPEGAKFNVCDCSLCVKRRIIYYEAPNGTWSVVRGFGKDGAPQIAEYKFASGSLIMQSCDKCGTLVSAYAKDKDERWFNMRAVRDETGKFDIWKLDQWVYVSPSNAAESRYEARNMPPPFHEVTLDDLPGAKEHLAERAKDYDYPTKTYTGSCHCKAINFAVVCKPLEEIRAMDCSCSICQGNGDLWIYPGRRNVFFYPSASPDTPWTPKAPLTEYYFGPKRNGHYFCPTCHCQIFEYGKRPVEDPRKTTGLTQEQLEARPPWAQENGWNGSFGLNISLLSNAFDILPDIYNLPDGKVEGKTKVMKGLQLSDEDKFEEPLYKLKL